MKTGFFLVAVLLSIILPLPAAEPAPSDAYAILYGLSAKERKAELIFWVKDASDGTHAVTKKIANLYGRIGDDLKRWAAADRTIDLKTTHLPPLEVETRETIDRGHTKEMMEDVKGKAFERMFMVLQYQSLWYGYALTQTLSEHEDNPERKKALNKYSQELRHLADEVYSRI
jgi:hypothetical protein